MGEARLTNLPTDQEDGLIDVHVTGGPPWGFNISGGIEFGRNLFVGKVAEDGIVRKVGGLKEGDTLVYINDVKYTSRAKAIEAVRFGKNELRLKLRRNRRDDEDTDTFVKKSLPKRSSSFYDSVVENMLENMSNDISSTHYSSRKSRIRSEKESQGNNKVNSECNDSYCSVSSDVSEKEEHKENLMPDDDYMVMRRTSSGSVQKVTIKSVNVTAMVPKAKEVISEQMKAKFDVTDGRTISPKKVESLESDCQVTTKKLKDQKQTRSVDEGDPTGRHFPVNPSGTRKIDYAPPVANRYRKAEQTDQESGIETPALSVSKARAMFEEISKSQENLAASATKSRSTDCILKSVEKDAAPVSAAPVSANKLEKQDASQITAPIRNPPLEHKHSHTKSLPLDTEEFTRRAIRRPGSAPNRRSERNMKAKSAHFPSEKEIFQSQNLPLGYADVSTSSNLVHGRKSIAMCAPGVSNYQYKKESSFRHSSEDLRASDLKDIASRKSVTLPANRMREAAKKFHQDLMRKDPKFRYSLSTAGEPATRPAHLGSFTGGSSGSSVGSSQDMLHAIDLSRRASGPTFFTRASSTSSLLDSPPAHQDAIFSPAEEEDNSILSRLLREQRLNSGGNLVRIDEEARSPRSKSAKNRDGVLSSEIEEPKTIDSSSKRTMSIQTDFVLEKPTNNESSQPGSSPKDKKRTIVTKSIASTTSMETNLDSIARPHEPAKSPDDFVESNRASQEDMIPASHIKEASTDSVKELQEINETRERELKDKEEPHEDFTPPDIDALPPPPDDFLIGSPPEKEKPQRVINRKKRDQHTTIGSSRNSSCVSTDSTISNSTSDSGIGVRAFSTSESPRTSPTRESAEFDDYDKEQNNDEGFKSSREGLDDEEYVTIDRPVTSPVSYNPAVMDDGHESPNRLDTPGSSRSSSRPDSMILVSPKIEELDQEKAVLVESMRKKIEELKSQEKEIGEEIKVNEDLGKKVQNMVETKAMQTEFSKYELFIGELNKIVALLLSLTQRLHRYEQMLQDLDMSDEEDKEKRDTLVAKIEKLKSQHEEACYLREVNDKRGENVANFLDKYFNEEEFQDFLYYVDMKSQLALMQSEIKEKVKLGEERYKALASTGIWTSSPDK